MADPASSQPQLLAYSTKVVPVRAWLEGERTNKGIFEPLAPALWAAEQESLSYARQKEEDWDHPQAASATSSASASATAAPSPSQPIHLEEGNGTRTAELLPISAGRKELSVPSALKILQSDREAVQRFLDGEICVSSRIVDALYAVNFNFAFVHLVQIDSRRFGNVGSFIRRRLHAQEAANRGGSSSSISSAGLSVPVAGSSSSSSSSGSNSGGGGGGDSGRMLHRRIVYTNKRYADRAPKLALFAARNIEPNTELLI